MVCILNSDDAVVLKENNWLDESDPDNVLFNNILEKLREGKVTEDDIYFSISKCSMYRMGVSTLKSRGFNDDGLSHLFCTNKDAEKL